MSINWTPNGNLYYIKVASSTSNATGIMKVYNSSTSIDLSNTTYNLTISSCKEDSNASNFKIGLFVHRMDTRRGYSSKLIWEE